MDGFEPGQLPAETSSFIGRGAEVAMVEALAARHRLVTIVGTGGCGKTRLALQVARSLSGRNRDQARFIGLGDAGDEREAAAMIARGLGLESDESATDEGLAVALSGGPTLVVLDNCEHVASACAVFVRRALERAAGVHILATSREPLRVAGEAVFPLGPMVLPDPRPSETGGLQDNEAVRLFMERAREHGSAIAATDETVRIVAGLCRTLDGLPLAIELAVSLVRTLGLRGLASLVQQGLPLDVQGDRTSPRQESMRSAVAWSYGLLRPTEQSLFRRLALFRGGWTLEAAVSVCTTPEDARGRDEVVVELAALVEKSLVLAVETDGVRRFRLLEPVRQYAAELLERDPSQAELRERHAGYYLGLLRRDGPSLGESGGRKPSLEWVGREIENFRGALGWALGSGANPSSVAVGMELTNRLFPYWHFLGPRSEGLRWAERTLELAGGRRDALMAELLRVAGEFAWLLGNEGLGRRQLGQNIELWREIGDGQGLAYALQALAPLGKGGERWLLVEESLGLFESLDDRWGAALVRFDAGIIALQDGDHASARSWMEAALDAFQRMGDDWFAGQVLNHLGDVARSEGDLADAFRRYTEALELCRAAGDETLVPSVLSNLGATEIGRAHTRRALNYYRFALRHFRDRGDARGVAECLIGLGIVRVALRHTTHGVRLFGAAESLMSRTGTQPWTANLGAFEGSKDDARGTLSEAGYEAAWAHGWGRPVAEVIEELLPAGESAPTRQGEHLPLTEREQEVAELMSRGLSNRAIAERLVITEGTAGLHAKRVLQKLGCRRRGEVVGVLGIKGPRPKPRKYPEREIRDDRAGRYNFECRRKTRRAFRRTVLQ